ncbi:protein transport protein Sec61 subunit gamma isoform X1 [Abrus precatorius]|uniref:Protein transport protein Sec61 subunit gamma isoform X1 n=1 Tax=Abrus precatorius TaxID=3816 RepID=A0A8B8JQQ1_ABRPR|nr:protein transport protein Sec61 subunit gamma isoform X1 [Abrus precatorius]
MDAIDSVFDPLREFAKDSVRLVKRCHKPDRKEFSKVAVRTAIGFVVMGFVGFFVKLIFIPINNIIVGSGWGPTIASEIQVVEQKEAERVPTSIMQCP